MRSIYVIYQIRVRNYNAWKTFTQNGCVLLFVFKNSTENIYWKQFGFWLKCPNIKTGCVLHYSNLVFFFKFNRNVVLFSMRHLHLNSYLLFSITCFLLFHVIINCVMKTVNIRHKKINILQAWIFCASFKKTNASVCLFVPVWNVANFSAQLRTKIHLTKILYGNSCYQMCALFVYFALNFSQTHWNYVS